MPRGRRRPPIIINEIDPQSLIAPETPAGYCTVAQWWAIEERRAFELLCNPLDTLREEEREVQRRAARAGIGPRLVAPSPLYKMLGHFDEAAFPERLLAEVYPLNP